MRLLILPFLLSIALLAPSEAWEIRGSIYPVEDGVIEWTTESFAGFNTTGSESLRFNISDELVNAGDAAYKSSIQNRMFAHKEWGYYSTLNFLDQEYFIGYPEDCRIAEPMSLLSPGSGSFCRVLIDSDESYTIASDEALPLKDGYNLKLSDTEDGVKVSLYKERDLIDSQVLSPPLNYVYKASIANETAAYLAVGIKANVKLEPKSYYTVNGLFQLSEDMDPIDIGMDFEEMEISAISETGIELKNPNDLSLSKGRDFKLLDGIRVRTSEINATFNQLCIYRNSNESDASEIRGEIATESFSWTPQNFAGFYYDMNEDLGTEEFSTKIIEGNRLDELGGITYSTTSQLKDFEFEDWGHYDIISFLGERCLASYTEDSLLCRDSGRTLLDFGKLGRVLIDSNEPRRVSDGDNLNLEDGIEAKIYIDNSCNSTLIELYKNEVLIDRDYFRMPNTYTYKKMFAGTDDEITVLGIHIAGADCSQKNILVNGIFQISEDFIEVSLARSFDKMKICAIDSYDYGYGIRMCNEGNAIILSKSLGTVLAGDYHIRVIDGDTLKYYVFKSVSV